MSLNNALRKKRLHYTHTAGWYKGETSKLYSGDTVATPPGYIQKVIYIWDVLRRWYKGNTSRLYWGGDKLTHPGCIQTVSNNTPGCIVKVIQWQHLQVIFRWYSSTTSRLYWGGVFLSWLEHRLSYQIFISSVIPGKRQDTWLCLEHVLWRTAHFWHSRFSQQCCGRYKYFVMWLQFVMLWSITVQHPTLLNLDGEGTTVLWNAHTMTPLTQQHIHKNWILTF